MIPRNKREGAMGALVQVRNLKTYFRVARGMLHAVDDVTFDIDEGTTMGCVGESGCGKTTLGRTLIHLQESTGGRIIFDGEDITRVTPRRLKQLRHKFQIVFQDPYSSINPRMTVADLILEPLVLSDRFSKAELPDATRKLMDLVGISKRIMHSYPHELDGGRRQRVGIARAVAMNPKFIVCDEPVSALDVSIQAQVLNLLQDLQQELKLTYLFVTHDMSVVRHISNNICVMYLGQLVETCESKRLFKNPQHPYTQVLLSAILSTNLDVRKERILMKTELASPINPKPGCRFAPRCMYTSPACLKEQKLTEVEPGHFVSCHRVGVGIKPAEGG
jgi:peptide/nickel transport system ATP-binding protein